MLSKPLPDKIFVMGPSFGWQLVAGSDEEFVERLGSVGEPMRRGPRGRRRAAQNAVQEHGECKG